MKNFFFDEKEFDQQEFNPLEILNAFRQLNKSTKQSSLPSHSHPPPIAVPPQTLPPVVAIRQFDKTSNNSKGQVDSMPKKTYMIKKQTLKQPKQQKMHQNQNSLGRISNFSKSQDINEENRLAQRKESFNDNNLNKTKSIILGDKQLSNLRLSEEIKELEARWSKKEEQFNAQKTKLVENCSKILHQTMKKKLQFSEFLSHQNDLKATIYQQQIAQRYQSEMHYLNEQTKTKAKRTKKNQIEDQENKSAQLIVRKNYISFLANKLSKQKQKYGTLKYHQYELIRSELCSTRVQQLKKHQFLKNYSLLCMIEGGLQHIEEILCMDMNKLQECTISCLTYSPILPKHKRNELFQFFKQTNVLAKRLTSPSPNIFFPNKVNLFIPISNIFSSQDQIFIVNQKHEQYNSLSKFLSRIDFWPTEQGLGVIKYVLTMSFKILEQLQNTKYSAVIHPKCIFVNQKYEVKFKNTIFNELIYHHFIHLLSEEDRYFFPPQENAQPQAATLWSIGMLAYHLYFNSKPFSKYNPYSWPSRQYFFVMNQIQYPTRVQGNEKIRQVIQMCMSGGNTKNVVQSYGDLLSNLPGK